MTEELKKEEKKRLQLSKEEIKVKEVMLSQEETKRDSLQARLKQLDDQDILKIQKLQAELQLLQLKQQSKLIPQIEEDFKNEKYKEHIKTSIKDIQNQLATAEQNVKVLLRQLGTKMA